MFYSPPVSANACGYHRDERQISILRLSWILDWMTFVWHRGTSNKMGIHSDIRIISIGRVFFSLKLEKGLFCQWPECMHTVRCIWRKAPHFTMETTQFESFCQRSKTSTQMNIALCKVPGLLATVKRRFKEAPNEPPGASKHVKECGWNWNHTIQHQPHRNHDLHQNHKFQVKFTTPNFDSPMTGSTWKTSTHLQLDTIYSQSQ